MTQFYVQDALALNRCYQSCAHKQSTTIGVDAIDGKVKWYTGVVQSVEDSGAVSQKERRRLVTISESN
jgi:hypothetical protein